jgi:hypothetical protein
MLWQRSKTSKLVLMTGAIPDSWMVGPMPLTLVLFYTKLRSICTAVLWLSLAASFRMGTLHPTVQYAI